MNVPIRHGGLLAHDSQVAALWEKLRFLPFDGGTGPNTFAARLAREQGWSAEFAARAIEEYRRFLLLFALEQDRFSAANPSPGGQPAVRIVPSAVIDAVWHLHLLYTRSYWDALCRDIVGAPLHHLPAEGAGGEGEALGQVYRDTLEKYVQTFGEPAPRGIWPSPPTPRIVAPPNAAAVARRPRPAAMAGSSGLAGLFVALVFCGGLILSLAKDGVTPTNVVFAVLCLVGAIGFVCLLRPRPGASRRRGVGTAAGGDVAGAGGDGGGGWDSVSGGDTGSTHHGSHGSGHHDGGGSHGHSDGGGHSCGGHSCGGHGCGGGSCGGGGCGGH